MILSAFLLLCCAVATWTVSPAKAADESESPSSDRGADADHPAYATLDQVKADLQRVGLESSNLIIGVDFTKSNEWTGKRCFAGRSLHDLGAGPNPYEEAIGIVGETLSAYDEDNAIPCFGFGDTSTHDQGVFSFYGDGRPCAGVPEALERYREIAAAVQLSGPTSLAPIIEAAMAIVQRSGHQYHILLIIADGQVPRGCGAYRASYPEESRSENYMEERTLQALIHARYYCSITSSLWISPRSCRRRCPAPRRRNSSRSRRWRRSRASTLRSSASRSVIWLRGRLRGLLYLLLPEPPGSPSVSLHRQVHDMVTLLEDEVRHFSSHPLCVCLYTSEQLSFFQPTPPVYLYSLIIASRLKLHLC